MGLQRRDKQIGYLLQAAAHRVDFLDGRSGALLSVAVCQAPGVASLITVSVGPGRIVRFTVEPPRCFYVRLTDVCRIPIAPDPLHHEPPSRLVGHDVHQGSHRKTGPRRTIGNSMFRADRVRWPNPSWAGLELCFLLFAIGLGVDVGQSLTTAIREEIRWRLQTP